MKIATAIGPTSVYRPDELKSIRAGHPADAYNPDVSQKIMDIISTRPGKWNRYYLTLIDRVFFLLHQEYDYHLGLILPLVPQDYPSGLEHSQKLIFVDTLIEVLTYMGWPVHREIKLGTNLVFGPWEIYSSPEIQKIITENVNRIALNAVAVLMAGAILNRSEFTTFELGLHVTEVPREIYPLVMDKIRLLLGPTWIFTLEVGNLKPYTLKPNPKIHCNTFIKLGGDGGTGGPTN